MNIKNFFARWRKAPAPVAAPASQTIPWERILSMLTPEEPPPRPLRLPDVLPGVRPTKLPQGPSLKLAMDGGYQEPMAFDDAIAPAAWGFPGATNGLGPGLSFLGFPFLAELIQISEYRIPSETLSTEMCRRWMKLKNKGKRDLGDKLLEIEERLQQLNVRDLFREAALKTEQFGRAHLYVSVKGQDDDVTRQLPLTTIEKGSLLRFSCIEPYWLTPYSWNATHPERPDFYRPQSWFCLGRKTHSSRLLTFIFREVPDLLKPAYDFSGISITQLMLPYVQRWQRTAKNVNDLINIFSIVTLSTDMQTYLQNPTEFIKRMQVFTRTRDNRGLMTINQGTETLATTNVPLSSLDKLQAQAQEHMATPGRVPLIKFFGITPSGLNATSEGEFRNWYDYVHGLQELGFTKLFERVLELTQMDLYGTVDTDITFEWLSLDEPTGKELGEIRKADADRDAVYLDKGVISNDEVREKLQMDPESGYDGLEGDAPEPPEFTEENMSDTGEDDESRSGD